MGERQRALGYTLSGFAVGLLVLAAGWPDPWNLIGIAGGVAFLSLLSFALYRAQSITGFFGYAFSALLGAAGLALVVFGASSNVLIGALRADARVATLVAAVLLGALAFLCAELTHRSGS